MLTKNGNKIVNSNFQKSKAVLLWGALRRTFRIPRSLKQLKGVWGGATFYCTRNNYNIVEIKYRTMKYGIHTYVWRCQTMEWTKSSRIYFKKFCHHIEEFKGAMATFRGRTCGCSYCILRVLLQMWLHVFMLIIYVHLTPHLCIHCTHPFTSIFHRCSVCFTVSQ